MAKGAGAKAAKAAAQDESNTKKKMTAEEAEAAKWNDGAKGKSAKEDKAEKAAAARATKIERERILAEEEASIKPKPTTTSKSHKKSSSFAKKTAPEGEGEGGVEGEDGEVPSYSASNLDDALDALNLVNEKTDKAAIGAEAAKIETHPERRFKAAFEHYKEKQLTTIRKEHPGLRMQQYNELLYKEFQKHPDNPFNQVTAAYDATKADKIAAMQAKRAETDARLRSDQ